MVTKLEIPGVMAMTLGGKVENGRIVLDGVNTLPEGASVHVTLDEATPKRSALAEMLLGLAGRLDGHEDFA